MKRCPTCQESYTDETLKFCRVDGALLISDSADLESSETALLSQQRTRNSAIDEVQARTPSIAVLPFVNMSVDREQEYFCDGLAEELINALSKTEDLKVAARTSAFSFKGKDVKVSEIGQALNVGAVLEGSVRKAGNRLRIIVQLINASDGYHLWSERYDRQMEDVFEIQDEITLAIVEALKVKLLGAERAALLRRYTENTEAYHLYLKGRYYWNKRTELKKGIEYFQQAIELDPNYALSYVGLADCYNLLAGHSGLSPKETFPRAKVAALKALELDGKLAEAHASLGFVMYRFDWDWLGAEREFKRALEMNPSYATANHWYGEFLALMGRFGESIAEMRRAQELDPLSLPINTDMGQSFFFARQYHQAEEQFRKTLEIDPNFVRAHVLLGECYEQMLRYDEAEAEFQKAVEQSGGKTLTLAALGHAYAMSGKRTAAQKMLDDLVELAQKDYVSPYDIAVIHTGLGEPDLAFAWLDKAYQDRSVWSVCLQVDPRLDTLRQDARFTELLRGVNLRT
jgi:adenylate cyclase